MQLHLIQEITRLCSGKNTTHDILNWFLTGWFSDLLSTEYTLTDFVLKRIIQSSKWSRTLWKYMDYIWGQEFCLLTHCVQIGGCGTQGDSYNYSYLTWAFTWVITSQGKVINIYANDSCYCNCLMEFKKMSYWRTVKIHLKLSYQRTILNSLHLIRLRAEFVDFAHCTKCQQ